jgi:signal peptidase I
MAIVALLAVGAILQSAAWALWTIIFVGFGVFVAGVFDVARLAVRAPLGGRRYGMVLVGAVGVIVLFGAFQPVMAHVVEPFSSPTITMAPTLEPGDHFFVDKRRRALKRGDVVVFRVPWARQMLRIKRAVALAGDTVEMRDGALFVNGSAIASRQVGTANRKDGVYEEWEEAVESHAYRVLRIPRGSRSTFGPVTVPAGHFFMVGDNRDRNNDSRLYDSIPLDMIVGRASFIWWSREPAGDVRWDRMGRRL